MFAVPRPGAVADDALRHALRDRVARVLGRAFRRPGSSSSPSCRGRAAGRCSGGRSGPGSWGRTQATSRPWRTPGARRVRPRTVISARADLAGSPTARGHSVTFITRCPHAEWAGYLSRGCGWPTDSETVALQLGDTRDACRIGLTISQKSSGSRSSPQGLHEEGRRSYSRPGVAHSSRRSLPASRLRPENPKSRE